MSFFRPRYAHKVTGTTAGTPVDPTDPSTDGLYAEPMMADEGTLMIALDGDVVMGLVKYLNPLNLGGISDTPPVFGTE